MLGALRKCNLNLEIAQLYLCISKWTHWIESKLLSYPSYLSVHVLVHHTSVFHHLFNSRWTVITIISKAKLRYRYNQFQNYTLLPAWEQVLETVYKNLLLTFWFINQKVLILESNVKVEVKRISRELQNEVLYFSVTQISQEI